jgi:hypothetical protein
MFTGALPYEHQIATVRTDFGMIADECFLTDMDGHTSIGLSANPWLAPDFGFDELFNRFKTISPYRRFNDGIDVRRFVANSEETGFRHYLSFISEVLHNENRIKSVSNGISTYLLELFKSSRFASPVDGGASILSREIKKVTNKTSEPYVLFATLWTHTVQCILSVDTILTLHPSPVLGGWITSISIHCFSINHPKR